MFLVVLGLLFIGVAIGSIVWLLLPSLVQGYSQVTQRQVIRTATALEDVLLLPVRQKDLNVIYTISSFGLAIVSGLFFKSIVMAAGGFVLGLLLPMMVVKFLVEINRKKFISQMVDTLTLLSSCLKAGLTLPQSFETVVEEMPRPTKDEFALVLQQMKMGVPLEEALNRLRRRIRDEDLDIVVISVLVARDTGGNVTEVFASLANMIREKKKINRRVQVLTSQARLQAMLITAMPFLFVPFVLSQDPHYFDIFFQDSIGQAILAYAVFSQVMGLLMMWMLSKVEV